MAEQIKARAEQKVLQKTGAYFRAIIQHSLDIVFVVDAEGMITYASPSTVRYLGYRPEELIGTSAFELIVPANLPKVIQDYSRALTSQRDILIPNAFTVRHKDGTERILEGFGNNLLHNSDVAGFVMNVRDVTERKRTEQALRKSEERFNQVAENAGEWIWEVDAEGLYQYCSMAVEGILGYRCEELVGKMHFYDLFSPDIRQDLKIAALKSFTRKESFRNFLNRMSTKTARSSFWKRAAHPFWMIGGIFLAIAAPIWTSRNENKPSKPSGKARKDCAVLLRHQMPVSCCCQETGESCLPTIIWRRCWDMSIRTS